jgi:ubiquinone biosynthesis protein COQ9
VLAQKFHASSYAVYQKQFEKAKPGAVRVAHRNPCQTMGQSGGTTRLVDESVLRAHFQTMTESYDQTALIDAIAHHAAFDGWSNAALRRAAEETAIPLALAMDWFPTPVSMIAGHSKLADERMLEVVDEEGFDELGTTDKLHRILGHRLEQAAPVKEAVRRGLSHLALPHHLYTGTRLTWATADAAWKAVGASDRDFNFVTKRTLLSGVYGATLTYWLATDDPDLTSTKRFLDHRLRNVVRAFGALGGLRSRIMGV